MLEANRTADGAAIATLATAYHILFQSHISSRAVVHRREWHPPSPTSSPPASQSSPTSSEAARRSLRNWGTIKAEERARRKGGTGSQRDQAFRPGSRHQAVIAAHVGLDWADSAGVLDKVPEDSGSSSRPRVRLPCRRRARVGEAAPLASLARHGRVGEISLRVPTMRRRPRPAHRGGAKPGVPLSRTSAGGGGSCGKTKKPTTYFDPLDASGTTPPEDELLSWKSSVGAERHRQNRSGLRNRSLTTSSRISTSCAMTSGTSNAEASVKSVTISLTGSRKAVARASSTYSVREDLPAGPRLVARRRSARASGTGRFQPAAILAARPQEGPPAGSLELRGPRPGLRSARTRLLLAPPEVFPSQRACASHADLPGRAPSPSAILATCRAGSGSRRGMQSAYVGRLRKQLAEMRRAGAFTPPSRR